MTFDDEPESDHERSAAVDAWVTAFDREMAQRGDFAATVGAMSSHGCFDVRAVVERWVLANPTSNVTDARPQGVVQESEPLRPVLREAPALAETPVLAEPALDGEPTSPVPVSGSSPDIAHFHSLLQGGIDRAQIYEAFPAFRLVIDEAVVQYESAAPILSAVPAGPSREDLDHEIRRTRQELEESVKRPRRRWRSRG